jgi:hypothetical protein
MTIKEHRDIESKSEKSKKDEMPPLEDYNNVEYLVDKEALVISRTLNVQIKKDDIKQQREKIFHAKYHINNKI